jgi:hypothetical protein
MYQEVEKFIMSMQNNKASGFDGIPAKTWKVLSTKNEGTGILTDLFNQIKNKKIVFPSEWKTTIICLICKGKGCTDEPGYYRGMSLLSVLGKIFSGILAGRVRDWLVNHEVLSTFQAGFVRGKRTLDVFIIKTIVDKYMKGKRSQIYFGALWSSRKLLIQLIEKPYGLRGGG